MSGEISLSHKLDCSAVAFASEQDLLLLASLVAPETAGQNDRAPIDLVAVLDRCYISFIAVLIASRFSSVLTTDLQELLVFQVW